MVQVDPVKVESEKGSGLKIESHRNQCLKLDRGLDHPQSLVM